MSGEVQVRNIQLTAAEHSRLLNTCTRVDNLAAEVNNQISPRVADMRQEMEDRLTRLGSEMESHNQNLSREMQELDAARRKQLLEQAEQFHDAINRLDDELHEELEEMDRQTRQEIRACEERSQERMDRMRNALERTINANHLQLSGRLDSVQRNVEGLNSQNAEARAAARQYASDSATIIDEISRYHPERHCPGQLGLLARHLETIQGQLEKQPQAALSGAVSLLYSAVKLRDEVFIREIEFEEYLGLARRSALEARETCLRQRESFLEILSDQGVKRVPADIDLWTEGLLSEYFKAADLEMNRLEDAEAVNGVDDLRASIENTRSLRDDAASLTDVARVATLANQRKENLVQDILDSLGDNWQAADSGFEHGDDRRSYYCIFCSPSTGDVITVRADVDPLDLLKTDFDLDFFWNDQANTVLSQPCRRRIVQGLKDRGWPIAEDGQCRPGSSASQNSRAAERLNIQEIVSPRKGTPI